MQRKVFLGTLAGVLVSASSLAQAGSIDCAQSSWNTGTGVVTLRITGLTPGQTVAASVYNDNTCTARASAITPPAGGDGSTVIVIDTGGTATAGDKVVISDPGCAELLGDGSVNCAGSCPACSFGACCLSQDECHQVTSDACSQLSGVYHGDGTPCAADGSCIPAVSEWGMVAMVLLVLAAGTVVARRRFRVAS